MREHGNEWKAVCQQQYPKSVLKKETSRKRGGKSATKVQFRRRVDLHYGLVVFWALIIFLCTVVLHRERKGKPAEIMVEFASQSGLEGSVLVQVTNPIEPSPRGPVRKA